MNYTKIDGLSKEISKIVFGTAVPKLFAAVGTAENSPERNAAYALLDEMYACGINTFDCAAHYGEEVLGAWMEARGLRDSCVVLTKCAHPNKWRHRVTGFDILADAHDSLKKLRTDCIDIYMLHRDNRETPVAEVVDAMNRLYQEGKIKIIGASNWTHQRMEEANEYAAKHGLEPFRASSPNFGLAEQIADPWLCDAHFGDGCVTIAGPKEQEARAWYRDNHIPVFAYSSLARGLFSGAFTSANPEDAKKVMDEPGIIGYYCPQNIERLSRCEQLAKEKNLTVAQIAMAWIFHQDFEVLALSSPANQKQAQDNIRAMSEALTLEEVKWLNLA